MKNFYEDNNTCLYLGDSLEILSQLDDNSIDLVFADPPYNMQLNKDLYRPNQTKVNGVGSATWDSFSSFQSYDDFSIKWLKEVKRVLKDNGTFWVIGSYHNIFRIGKIVQDLDFWILNDVIWAKSNPMPNFKGTRFTNAHETLLWCAKNKKSKYYFHYHSMKILNDDKQMSSIWELPICSGLERVKSTENETLHPTQKPLSLLGRVLLSSTKEEDIVLDPFLGSGTTGVVCKMMGRKFIGIDKEEKYLDISLNRIKQVVKQDTSSLQVKKKNKQRISVGGLISNGYLELNSILYDKNGNNPAKIKLDGSIELENGQDGSIHQIASGLLGKAVNGWDFWYLKNKNNLVSLDDIRQKYFINNAKKVEH